MYEKNRNIYYDIDRHFRYGRLYREKTITETVEKRAFTEEPTLTTTAETGTERVSKEPIFYQTTTANTEPKQDTHTQKEMPKSEKSEPEITTNTVSEVTTAVEQIEEFDINYWISYAQNYAQSICSICFQYQHRYSYVCVKMI